MASLSGKMQTLRRLALTSCETTRTWIRHRCRYRLPAAHSSVAIIALGRCYRMVSALVEKYCPDLQVPGSVTKTQEAVLQMRNAFEHIDERAEGNIGRGKPESDALTIFNQPDFVPASILRYKHGRLRSECRVRGHRCPVGLSRVNHEGDGSPVQAESGKQETE